MFKRFRLYDVRHAKSKVLKRRAVIQVTWFFKLRNLRAIVRTNNVVLILTIWKI